LGGGQGGRDRAGTATRKRMETGGGERAREPGRALSGGGGGKGRGWGGCGGRGRGDKSGGVPAPRGVALGGIVMGRGGCGGRENYRGKTEGGRLRKGPDSTGG